MCAVYLHPLLVHAHGDIGSPEAYAAAPYEIHAQSGDVHIDGVHEQLER